MKLIGLTGGIGMGKSAAALLLAELGARVIDTDALARELVQPGLPALRKIREAFGPEVIAADGTLCRAQLARRVFSDPEARRRLEDILHPPIRDAWQARASAWRQEDVSLAVVVIPLLFETDAASNFDVTICVACSPASQRSRLHERGWSDEQITERNQAQWPIQEKIAAADFVTWAEGPLAVHSRQLQRILEASSKSEVRTGVH